MNRWGNLVELALVPVAVCRRKTMAVDCLVIGWWGEGCGQVIVAVMSSQRVLWHLISDGGGGVEVTTMTAAMITPSCCPCSPPLPPQRRYLQ